MDSMCNVLAALLRCCPLVERRLEAHNRACAGYNRDDAPANPRSLRGSAPLLLGVNWNYARLCRTIGSHSRPNLDFCRCRTRRCHRCLCHGAFRPLIHWSSLFIRSNCRSVTTEPERRSMDERGARSVVPGAGPVDLSWFRVLG